jgi:hypothetical protein
LFWDKETPKWSKFDIEIGFGSKKLNVKLGKALNRGSLSLSGKYKICHLPVSCYDFYESIHYFGKKKVFKILIY